ncbi:expressed ef-hand domain-containing isoform A [Chlorella sorokiniana]|uniref:Expressed ef-hand domain-containing isoform A n=1 Tax=Chlorella sorokiniana TaxID=3076 RepID=A0A2P6TIJ9_CHLSO|nr:expressed ef-hand domain-containing isoform A [Chlorella sorokiniana]|eukprot:PRW39076.1 expressed ef-hand domain-containing isoform A [Chlorella sorokiniana]
MAAALAPRGAAPGPALYSPAYTAGGHDADSRSTLLVTTVDIGEGRQGRVEVREGDDPVDVARAFCARHGLPEAIVLPLAQHLEDNLAESIAGAGGGDYSEEEYEVQPASARYTPSPTPPASHTAVAEAGAPAGAGARVQLEPSAAGRARRPSSGASAAGSSGQAAAPHGAPAAHAAAQAPAESEPPLTHRPAAINSARGAQYFNDTGSPDPCSLDYRSAGTAGGSGSGGGLPAHNRLYADHFRKQQRLEEERRLRDLEIQLKTEQVHIAPASGKLASHRTAGAYRNYGERLYVEGRLDAMRKEQMAARQKEEEERAELEAYSFRPTISKLARQIKASEAVLGGPGAAYQRLYQRASDCTVKRQERMAAIRREQDEAEIKECSFRPQINAKSARMVEGRQQILRETRLPGYEQLYNDSMRRRLKLEALAQLPPEEATFRPRVNTSSVVLKRLMEGREGEVPLGGSDDVATRLLERGRRYQEKLAAAQREAEEAPRDPATGRPLFQPKTYRPPSYDRNPDGAPIGERLYSIKAEWDDKAARLRREQERRAARDAASTYVNNKSEKLVDRLKRERFRAVFDYLRRGAPAPVVNLLEAVQDVAFMDTIDPEVRADVEFAARALDKAIARRQAAEGLQDCATSAVPASSQRSSSTAASAAAPPYAQSTNGEVDAAGFVALMEEVVARTKGLTRQYLLPMPSTRAKFEEPSFRPAIDPRSAALAARVRPESLPAYEVLYKTAEEIATKREDLRRAAEAAKLKECLFRPVMVAEPKAKEGRAMKMAAELTQSKRNTTEEEAPAEEEQEEQPVPASKGGTRGSSQGVRQQPGSDLHFDVLERQINDALVRLSLSEEQVAASLQRAQGGGGAAVLAGVQGGQSVDAAGYRLDFHALLGSPSPDSMLPISELAQTATSSLGGFNPMDDAEGPGVAWDDNSQEVVAHVLQSEANGAAADAALLGQQAAEPELAGLDLHALASADLPEHPGDIALGVPAAAAAAVGSYVLEAAAGGPSKESSTQWETPRDTLVSPGMSPAPAGQ